MLFEPRLREGIRNGSITLAFRRWTRPQVVAGHAYRMGAGAGLAHVESVDVVEPSTIDENDAQAAGFASRDELLRDLTRLSRSKRWGVGSVDGTNAQVYRVRFRAVAEPDPREVLAESDQLSQADIGELNQRLDRLDRSSAHGPWTRETLAMIGRHPGVRAGDLAPQLGWSDLAAFKLHVRKLKALGLTISLLVGYELSPRGQAFARATGLLAGVPAS